MMTNRAERDLEVLYRTIHAEHSLAALKWYLGLKDAILSLADYPKRCPLTRKRDKLRHLLYGGDPHIYRVIYRIVERHKEVEILHIRHGARRKSSPDDLA
jgi:plasmid stabilization system protein ParE